MVQHQVFNNSVNRYNVLSQEHLDYTPLAIESTDIVAVVPQIRQPRAHAHDYASKPTAATNSNPNYHLPSSSVDDELLQSPKQAFLKISN